MLRDEILEDLKILALEASKELEEPNSVKDFRLKALNMLRDAKLADTRYTKFTKIFENWLKSINSKDFLDFFERKVSIDLKNFIRNVSENDVIVILLDGNVYKVLNADKVGEENLKVFTISEAFKTDEEKIFPLLETFKYLMTEDKFYALNHVLRQGGTLIYVSPKTEMDGLIKIVNVFTGKKLGFISNLIFVGDSSNVKIVEEVLSLTNIDLLKRMVSTNLLVGSGANVVYSKIFLPKSPIEAFFLNKYIVNRDGKLNSSIVWVGGKHVLSNTSIKLVAPGGEVEHVEVVFGDFDEKYDLYTKLDHVSGNTRGEVIHRGVLKGSARQVYGGLIKIRKGAQGTDSFLSSHTILLSRNASSFDIPGLEIEANEVRATHSASVSPIDENHIFYLRSRGLGEEEAKKLITFGFLDAALSKIPLKEFTDFVKNVFELRWYNKKLF